jgi:hypothetical protein
MGQTFFTGSATNGSLKLNRTSTALSVSVLARIDNLESQFVSPNSSEFHFLAVDCLLLNQA